MVPDDVDSISNDPRAQRSRLAFQDALRDLLQEKAYRKIRVTDVCDRADVTRPTFYQHYKTMDDLLLSLVKDYFSRVFEDYDMVLYDQFIREGRAEQALAIARQRLGRMPEPWLMRIVLHEIPAVLLDLALESAYQNRRAVGLPMSLPARIIVTYHVSGMLMVWRAMLNSKEHGTTSTRRELLMEALPVVMARALRLEAFENGLMGEIFEEPQL